MIALQFTEDQLLDALVKKINDGFCAAERNAPEEKVLTIVTLRRRAIHEALSRTDGDKTAAALLLGLSKSTLYRWLAKYS